MENYLVSARKYRPATFKSVVGQKALTATLKNSIATDRLAHAYLFCGSRGVGKTSCARIFAKTINCEHRTADGDACNECASCRAFNEGRSLNIVELDAASNNGVDDIRSLVDQVQVPPTQGRYRVFIIDEVHMLSTAAFNAFLKTLEEPPSYVIFILATTEKHKIIPTILSRCQIYDFNRITIQDMIDHLGYVAEQEGITAEPSALNIIARKADGAMRDALSIFDQVAASSMGHITYQSTLENLNVLDHEYYNRLLDAFLTSNVPQSLLIYKEIREKGFDSQFFITGLASYFRDLMVAYDPSTVCLLEASDNIRKTYTELARRCTTDFLYAAMNLCNKTDLNYRIASNKQFLVELTLIQLCQLLSPSPVNRGDGEGQLKKIEPAVPTATASTVPQTTPTPQQSPSIATEPRVTYSAPTPKPAAIPRPTGKMANLRTPNLSLKGGLDSGKNASSTTSPTVREHRTNTYTDKQVIDAWNGFIASHPTEHVLINTMRAGQPTRNAGDTFEVMVENPGQVETMQQSMPEILQALRDATNNDNITILLRINEGESPAHTWNEREVLNHMIETIPKLRAFIDDFKLTLN